MKKIIIIYSAVLSVFLIISGCSSGGDSSLTEADYIKAEAPGPFFYSRNSAEFSAGIEIEPLYPSAPPDSGRWSIKPALPSGLRIDPASGVIEGTPFEIISGAVYEVILENDFGGASAQLFIKIGQGAPFGFSYSQSAASYKAGEKTPENYVVSVYGPVDFFSIEPSLPEGLEFNSSDGRISGTPLKTRSLSEFTVTAHNSSGSVSLIISIEVLPGAPADFFYQFSEAVYTAGGEIIKNRINKTPGGGLSFYSKPALPAGLKLDRATGTIFGIPQVPYKTAVYEIEARNAAGSSYAGLLIEVNSSPPEGIEYSSPELVCNAGGVILDNTLKNVKGSGLVFSVFPSLPPGLELDKNDGRISGTPLAETEYRTYTIVAENLLGRALAEVSIEVIPGKPGKFSYLMTDCVYSPGGKIIENSVFSAPGSGLTYSVHPPLPEGLELEANTGTISGVPLKESAKTEYLISASNKAGSSSCPIEIIVSSAEPFFSYDNGELELRSGRRMETARPVSLEGSGIVFSVSPALPRGLSLDPLTGNIKGTPAGYLSPVLYTVKAESRYGTASAEVLISISDDSAYLMCLDSAVVYSGPGYDRQWFTADDSVYGALYYDTDSECGVIREISVSGSGRFNREKMQNEMIISWAGLRPAENGENRFAYSSPGKDLIWFTGDDRILSYVFYEFIRDDNTAREIHYSGFGPDGLWLSGDDKISKYYLREYDDFDVQLRNYFYSDSGFDGVWLSYDDKYAQVTDFEYDSQGLPYREITYVNSAELKAGAKNELMINSYKRYTYNESGSRERIIIYSGPGSDLQWFTYDDSIQEYDKYVYEGSRDNPLYKVQYAGPGPDSVWFTEDDEAVKYERYTYSEITVR